jgi:PAS domain S-box-containing protein
MATDPTKANEKLQGEIKEGRHSEPLRDSEERFRLLVQSVKDYAIFMLDQNGYIESWNAGAANIKGYSADEAIGKHFSIFYPEEDIERDKPGFELKEAAATGRFEDEGWRLRKDGSRFWANVVITALRGKDGTLRGFGKVTRDLTDRKRLEEQRQQLAFEQIARVEAETAKRAMDEFLANVSHELRTPLNAIVGWARLLRSGTLNDESVARGLEAIDRNAQAQAQLIEDLLDVTRIISGKLRLTVGPVNLYPIIEAAIESMRPAADAKGIQLQSLLDSNIGLISGDPNRLQQVFWNLISNAVKFTPNGGRVQIRLQRANSHVEISVSDTGQGISADFLPYIFDRFRQADSAITRAQGGLGLGLAIVRQLTELHGGTVEALSPGKGLGSTFTIKLPVLVVAKDSGRFSVDGGESTAFMSAFGSPPSLEGLSVLIVDDHVDARVLLTTILEVSKAKVTAVGSAAEAYEAMGRSWPDVIVSDIEMPFEDGYSLIRNLRAGKSELRHRWIPAVALTAHARAEDRMRALSAGYQAHVAKPVEPNELVTLIATLMGRTSVLGK